MEARWRQFFLHKTLERHDEHTAVIKFSPSSAPDQSWVRGLIVCHIAQAHSRASVKQLPAPLYRYYLALKS